MVQETLISPLPGWGSFYVIVGSSAGALIGLQFVVTALIGESRRPATPAQIDAFGTPTIVHFCFVLILSAVLSAPWPSLRVPALLLGAAGLGGFGYAIVVTARVRRQQGYQPVLEDWIWHVILPFIAYAILLGAAIELGRSTTVALFLIGTIALFLLVIGIHNAWDTATFVVMAQLHGGDTSDDAVDAPPDP